MITPAFNITATERVLPKLALDFTTASLDSRVTFTRTTSASNPATYVNSSGYITAATNNEPRFDYDPVTLACRGLLIEEARTNIFTNSENFSDWGVVGGETSVTPASGISPANTNTANLLEKTGTNTFRSVSKSTTVVSGTAYVWTVFLKAGTAAQTRLRILNAADISLTVDWANPSANGVNFGNGWYRYQIAFTAATTIAQTLIYPSGSGTATGNIYAWGAQLEAGAFPTSYIPTTTTALTRNADVATMTGTNFSSWFNASEGSLMSLVNSAASLTIPTIVSLDGGNLNFIIHRFANGVGKSVVRSSGAVVVDMGTQSYAGTGPYQMCSSYKANDFSFATNGGNFVTDTAGTLPSPSELKIGTYGSSNTYPNGHIAKIMYWPMKLTNAEIVAFSKG